MAHGSKSHNRHPAGSRGHGTGVLREAEHDPYRSKGKPREGQSCSACHAEVHAGAWRWPEAAWASGGAALHGELCPACRRIRVHDAAGVLWIDPQLMHLHGNDIRNQVQRESAQETAGHSQERLMPFEEDPDGGWLIQTTGLHLLRRLAHALERSCSAHLEMRYAQGQHRAVMRLLAPQGTADRR